MACLVSLHSFELSKNYTFEQHYKRMPCFVFWCCFELFKPSIFVYVYFQRQIKTVRASDGISFHHTGFRWVNMNSSGTFESINQCRAVFPDIFNYLISENTKNEGVMCCSVIWFWVLQIFPCRWWKFLRAFEENK